jgi:hypothetical protein
MPSASQESRNLMRKWFGAEFDDAGPTRFLESHGYILLSTYFWKLPTPSHSVSCYEWECILFLIHEWDFGGIQDDNKKPTICLCDGEFENKHLLGGLKC